MAPIITTPTPTTGWTHGASVAISGSGFGAKTNVKPLIWAPLNASANDGRDATLSRSAAWGFWVGGSQVSLAAPYLSSTSPRTGTYCAQTDETATNTNFRSDVVAAYGDYRYVSCWRRATAGYNIYANLKWLRLWPATIGNQPDVYFGQPPWTAPNGPDSMVYCEPMADHIWEAAGDYHDSAPCPTTTWRHEEYLWRYNTTQGGTNGSFAAAFRNGSGSAPIWSISRSGVYFTNGSYPGPQQIICVQENRSNTPVHPAGTYVYLDDIYMDDSWARVYLGNAATLGGCNHLELQIPTAWAPTGDSITVTVNFGSFSTGDTPYLYVVDSANVANTNVYQVTLGSGGGSPPTGSIFLTVS